MPATRWMRPDSKRTPAPWRASASKSPGCRAAAVSAIPILSTAGALGLGWTYTVVVAQATLQILFASGEFAAVPVL